MGWVGARQDSAGPHPVPGLQPVPWVSGLARHSKVPLHTPQLDQHRGYMPPHRGSQWGPRGPDSSIPAGRKVQKGI